MKTTTVPTSKCSDCGSENDSASSVDGDNAPKQGSITVCLWCGHIMAFGKNLKLRELTKKEAYALAGDKRILMIQKARKDLGIKRN